MNMSLTLGGRLRWIEWSLRLAGGRTLSWKLKPRTKKSKNSRKDAKAQRKENRNREWTRIDTKKTADERRYAQILFYG
jgi:hypothetical protein